VSAMPVDLYQLTSLVTHHRAGLTHQPVVMTFFSRRLPQAPSTGAPARGFVLFAGLERALAWLRDARFERDALATLCADPMLGPALSQHPELVEALAEWRFSGEVRAPREGTPIFCGPAVRSDGTPLEVEGCRPAAYCPYFVITCDLLTAKLIETPLLSIVNHMSMVATKAAVVCEAAGSRPVIEFGTRRTHPEASVDAAVAAFLGGCAATSNVEAHVRYGVPLSGTHDHFAVQAWERPGVPRADTERAFFAAFSKTYPGRDALLVDTYDTFGERTGIHAAVASSVSNGGAGPWAIRIDSNVSADTIWRARQLLDGLGAIDTRIFVSGGVDERMIAALGDAPVDGFGVGENLVVSSDAPVGVGAVGKLTRVDGHPTTKLSRGSGKAHLPGVIQCFRGPDGDVVGLADEALPGVPLLETVWHPDTGPRPPLPVSVAREHARASLTALPPERKRVRNAEVQVSDALAALFTACVEDERRLR
jgi:nicotinate phosphoribosyltransferase